MIDQPTGESTRRRPGPPSDAIAGMADALIDKLVGGPVAQETRDDGSGDRASAVMPERIGRFEVDRRLGAGAMGVVYGAHDPMLRRDVAIKVLTYGRSSEGAQARARREAQAMAQLSHPNLVKVFAVGDLDGSMYIAMERIRGRTLAAWQSGERPWQEVVAVYRQAALGLAELHAHGLIHRDFKPANAMLGDDGRVRVLDLGLVRELAHAPVSEEVSGRGSGARLTSGSETLSDAFVGTPAYMAPEQFLGSNVGTAADQFSFCVALYEALYGHRPFKAKTMAQLVEAIASQTFDRPPGDTKVPRRIYKALRRGLAHEPQRRFGSMEMLLDALSGRATFRTVGGVAIAAALLAAVPLGGPSPASTCELQDRFDVVWNAERAQQRRSAAPEDPASGLLVREAEVLAGSVRRACERRASAAELVCLQEVVQRFDATARLIEDPPEGFDPEPLAEAIVPPSSCDGADAYAGRETELIELGADCRRVDALALGGYFDEALALGNDVVQRAQALGHDTLQYEAFYQRGKVHARRRALPEANADFTAAYEATLLARAPQATKNTASSLVWVTMNMGDLDAAEHWLNVSAAAEEAVTGRKGRGARHLMRAGELAIARGKYLEAEQLLLESLEGWRGWKNAREEATVLGLLVEVRLYLSKLDAGQTDAEKAIEVMTAALGDDEPQLGTHYRNLGSVLQRRGDHEGALVALSESLRRRVEAYGPDSPMTAMASCTKATALLGVGRTAEARALLDDAQAQLSGEDVIAAYCSLYAARAQASMGEGERAVADANRAIVELESALGTDNLEVADARAELAEIELIAGQAQQALKHARRARTVMETRADEDHDLVGRCLTVEADALRALQRPNEARPLYARAIPIVQRATGPASEQTRSLRSKLAAIDGT